MKRGEWTFKHTLSACPNYTFCICFLKTVKLIYMYKKLPRHIFWPIWCLRRPFLITFVHGQVHAIPKKKEKTIWIYIPREYLLVLKLRSEETYWKFKLSLSFSLSLHCRILNGDSLLDFLFGGLRKRGQIERKWEREKEREREIERKNLTHTEQFLWFV